MTEDRTTMGTDTAQDTGEADQGLPRTKAKEEAWATMACLIHTDG